MIKLSRTGITTLKRQYKSVLLKCLLINAGILLAGGIATPANAATQTITDNVLITGGTLTVQTGSTSVPGVIINTNPTDEYRGITILDGNLMVNATSSEQGVIIAGDGVLQVGVNSEAPTFKVSVDGDVTMNDTTKTNFLTALGISGGGSGTGITIADVVNSAKDTTTTDALGTYLNSTYATTAALADYSTTAQMNTAITDGAIQTIASGGTAGTLKIDGTDVAITTFDAAGAATQALTDAKTWVGEQEYQNATQVGTAISGALADYSTTAQMNTALAGKQDTIDADHKLSSTLVSFTTDETAVLGSGITSAKVSTYDGYATQIAGKLAGEEAGDYTISGKRGADLAANIATYVTNNGTKFADVQNTANIITDLFNDKALYMQETTGMDQAHSVEYNYNQSTEALLHGATSMLNADEILAGAIDDKLDKSSSTTADAKLELENADALFTATGSSTGYSNQLIIDNDENGIKLSANASGVGKKSSLDITSEGIFYNKGTTPSDNDEIVTLNTAADAVYNNTTSGLTATTIQSAIDETNAKFTDGSVDAAFKTVTTTGNISSSTGNIIATTGNIIATAGNITAANGSVSGNAVTSTTSVTAGTTVTAGTGVTATTGNITASAGNLVATAGNVEANAGSVSGKTLKNANSTFKVEENGDLAVSKSTTEYVKLNADGTMAASGAATFGGTTGSQVVLDGGVVTADKGLVVNAGGANITGNTTVKGTFKAGTNGTEFSVTKEGGIVAGSGNFVVQKDGDVNTKGTLTVAKATTLNDTLTVAKATTLNDTLTVAGATTLNSTLTVADTATFGAEGSQVVLDKGVVTADKGLVVKEGGANITGNSTIDGTLHVTDAVTLDKTLAVAGDTTIGNKFTVTAADGTMSAAGGKFEVRKSGSFVASDGNFEVKQSGSFDAAGGKFSVSSFGGITAADGNFVADKDGNVTAKGTLTVDKATTLNDTLTVAGATTLNSTLTVADTATFGAEGSQVVLDKGVVTADKGLVVNAGGANITGNSTIDGTLHVTDAVTLDKTLAVAGDTTIGNKFTVTAADGTMSAAGGKFEVRKSGSFVASDGNFEVKQSGSFDAAGGKFSVSSFGGITAADGNFVADKDGNVTAAGELYAANSQFHVTQYGGISAANGNFVADKDGDVTAKGTLTVAKAATLNDTLDVVGLTTLSADNGMRFGTGQVVKSIDAGVDAQTNPNSEALATVATVLKSAENADYTGTTLDATGNRPATVKDGLNLIGNVNSFAGGRYISGAETLADATVALDKGLSRLENKVRDFKKEFKSGMAQMAAMSALVPNARAHGNTQISVGTGAYEGQTAAAIGGFHWVNDNLMLNIGASYGDSNNMAYRAGLTWSW